MNLQPSAAEAGFDIRLPTFVDGEEIERLVKEEWAPASSNFTYEVHNYLSTGTA